MTDDLRKVALVTGASSGIGAAIAASLVTRGFKVFGTSRSERRDVPGGAEFVALDVTDDGSVRAAISRVLGHSGRIDVLVNSAGFGVTGAGEETSVAQARTLFDTNLFGLAQVTREVLPVMRQQRAGRIVNISSIFGFVPAPYLAFYAASKYAVEGYSESLDHEVRRFGIRVSLVEPGITSTNFDSNMEAADSPLPVYEGGRRATRDVYAKTLRSADDPRVVADAVLKAISAANPRTRYPAGKLARQLTALRRFAPPALFDRAIQAINKLPGGADPRPGRTSAPAARQADRPRAIKSNRI